MSNPTFSIPYNFSAATSKPIFFLLQLLSPRRLSVSAQQTTAAPPWRYTTKHEVRGVCALLFIFGTNSLSMRQFKVDAVKVQAAVLAVCVVAVG